MAITDRKLFLSILKDGGLILGIVFFLAVLDASI